MTITCPSCGSVSEVDEIRRDASEFCRTCDYPLFWARSAVEVGAAARGASEIGLRRLPGTAGRVAVATLNCWSCNEPNPITGVTCLRCGADLRPEPVTEVLPPPPPPPPPPAPEPVKRQVWPWVLAAVLVLALLVVLVLAYG